MFIGIASTIPDLPNLPGQGGGSGPEVTLDYSSSNFCADASDPTLTDASPAGGVFSYTGAGTLALNNANGAIDISNSTSGNYIVTYTVTGVGSSNFPINIGAVINTTITGDSATCIGSAPSPADLTAVSGYSNYEWFKDNVSVQNGASNTYTPAFNVAGSFVYKVIITDNSLSIPCTATSSNFTFTVNALPTISIAGTDFCAGQSTTLTATPSAGTFVWEVDTGSGYNVISGQTNNTISVSTAGNYRAKVTDANGCTSNYSNVLAITQFASPSVTIATTPGTTICTGDTATLTANPTGGSGSGYTYLWSTSATSQAINVSPTTTTTYTVTVTDSNGCTAEASQVITASTAATTIASIDNDYAMSFNGTDQYVSFPNLTLSSNEYSISLWMYSDQGTNVGYFLTDGNTAGGSTVGFKIDNNGTNIGRLEYWDGSSNRIFGTISSPASWNHIAFVANVSSNTITSYINGSVGVTATGVTVQTMYNLIGAYTPTGSNKFVGKLDEVAIFDSKLSSCDIKGIYEATTTVAGQPKSANLLDANTTIPAPVYWNRMGDS